MTDRLQPVEATRIRQLNLWKEIVLAHYKQKSCPDLDLETTALFSNDLLKRELSIKDRRIAMQHIIDSGHGEWTDESTKRACQVFWKQSALWANEIYAFVRLSAHYPLGALCKIFMVIG